MSNFFREYADKADAYIDELQDRIKALEAEKNAAVLAEREACERAVWRAWTKTTNLGDVGNACHDAIRARSNKRPEQ